MSRGLVPSSFWNFSKLPSLWDEDWDMSPVFDRSSGLAISEDDKHVYVEAPVPGVDPSQIEVSFDKGTLWVRGEAKTEEKDRKYYQKTSRSFSYQASVPGVVDENSEPTAACKNGVITVTFKKAQSASPKKITVKAE